MSLSAAVAAGAPESVRAEVEEALREGAPAPAVYEALVQSYLFIGFPRAIEALFAARPALEDRGAIPATGAPLDAEMWMRRGESLCRRVYGSNYEKLMRTMRELSPDLASWMLLEGYGKTLSRPALEPPTREYCVVAILATTRMWRQLRSHAIGAVNVGGSRSGVRESIERCATYAGEATVREALRVAGLEPSNARS